MQISTESLRDFIFNIENGSPSRYYITTKELKAWIDEQEEEYRGWVGVVKDMFRLADPLNSLFEDEERKDGE